MEEIPRNSTELNAVRGGDGRNERLGSKKRKRDEINAETKVGMRAETTRKD